MMTILAATALVGTGQAAVPENFDLSRTDGRAMSREQASQRDPVRPHNLDTRDFAVEMPEIQLPLAERGPVLLVGAMGGRSGGRYGGMPKLAHVALGWSF